MLLIGYWATLVQPTRAADDSLPPGAIARLGTTRFRHLNRIFAVTFAPDGKTIASGSHDETAAIWDRATGKLVHRLRGHRGAIDGITYSPDGKLLATGSSDKTIRLWNTITGTLVRTLVGHENSINSLVFLPGGKRLVSGGFDNAARIWDVETGKETRQALFFNKEVLRVACSPDGTILAVAVNDDKVRLYDLSTLKELRSCAGDYPVFSPDGRTLAVAHDRTIELRATTTGKLLRSFLGSQGDVWGLAFAPDGQTLGSGECGAAAPTVRLWDVSTGKKQAGWPGHEGGVFALAFSPDGKQLVTAGGDFGLRLRDVATGKESPALPGHRFPVVSMSVARGNRLVSAASDGSLHVWDLARMREQSASMVGEIPQRLMLISPDGRWLLSIDDLTDYTLTDVTTGKVIYQRRLPRSDRCHFLAFAPDSKTMLLGNSSQIVLFDSATGKELRRLSAGAICCATFAPDGKRLAVGYGGPRVEVFDSLTLKSQLVIELPTNGDSHEPEVHHVVFSPDGRTLAFSRREAVLHLWDVERGKPIGTIRHEGMGICSSVFSADGRFLATGNDNGKLALWEVATRKLILELGSHENSIKALAFHGRRLISGSADSTILVWDITGKALGQGVQKTSTALWQDLAREDVPAAYRAVWQLVNSPEATVKLLREQLQPAPLIDQARIDQLIADLESNKFPVREEATRQLYQHGFIALPALKKVLAGPPTLEVRRRVEGLLERIESRILSAEQLRECRAIYVLEEVASPAARDLLRRLAHGGGGAVLTREAKAALERLNQRSAE
jgi:WD40 repeat protein